MSVCSFPVSAAFWKGRAVGQAARSKARPEFQQGLSLASYVTWDASVGSFPAFPCFILSSVGTNFRIVAAPCFGHCEIHRWELSTSNTEGLVCSRNTEAEAAASAWGSSTSGISSSGGGGSRCVCVWFLCVFFMLWAWQSRDSGQPTSHLYGFSPQIVARWLGAFLSPCPEGSPFKTSLGPHLPLLFVLSCSGMLWSYFWIWSGLPWLKVWQSDCRNGMFLFYA